VGTHVAQSVDTAPLIHHIGTHAEQNTLEIACFGTIGEDFRPGWLLFSPFCLNVLLNLIQLQVNQSIIIGLVEKTSDHMTRLVLLAMFREPARCLWYEQTEDDDDQ
jgi:hypothetical protein